MALGAYDRVAFRGFTFNRKTKRMILWAERHAGVGQFHIAQGSFNGSKVSASAGTHSGSSLDVGMAGVSTADRVKIVHALKLAGFAAWYRRPVPGLWGAHVHCIPFADHDVKDPTAKAQLAAYDNHRDGLAGNKPDTTFRPSPKRRWGWLRNRPVTRT